jgi:spore germination protein GerM
MNNFSRFIVFIVICLGLWWVYDNFLSERFPMPEIPGFETKNLTDDIEQKEPKQNLPETDLQTEEKVANKQESKEKANKQEIKTDDYVYVYLLTTDKNGTQFLKPVQRPLVPGQDRLTCAIKLLIGGPNYNEKEKGIYTEVPANSHINGITTTDSKIIIDLSNTFTTGGGSDSLYSRLRQLIKTVIVNTKQPVYLYIDGKQADIIGGEGLTISQPLSEKSLDE